MGRRIELPQLPQGQTQEQLQALYSYLYRMAEALNNNLAEIGNGDFTDEEMVTVRQITGETGTGEGMAEAETLKSLIIKTAQLIKSEIDEYNLKLIGTYEADGKLGRYVRKTRLDVDVTPTGITQNYTFESIVQGLKTYEVNAKNYIKTGLLRTVSDVPVYGVAIGKDVVTFSNDGTETYNDGNKVAELTADELSFWQNGNKVASYTGTAITLYSGDNKLVIDPTDGMSFYKNNVLVTRFKEGRISFYYNGSEVFYIMNGKIYAAGDLQIQSGKTFKIVSGGTMDVNTNNFKIDSANKLIESDKFKFDSTGITFTDNGYKLKFGRFDYLEQNVMAAVMAEMSNNYEGKLRLIASPGTTTINASFELQCVQRTDDTTKYIRRLLFNGNGIAGSAIGCDNYSGGVEFAQIGTIVVDNENSFGGIYGGIFKIIFDPYFNPISQYYVPNNTPRVEISHNEAVYNGAMRVYYFNNAGGSNHIYVENVIDVPTLNVTNLTYTNIYQSSSKEIKHDIRDMEPRGEQLDRLRPVTFVYDDDPEEKVRAGLIYEDTMEVMPEICTGDESSKAINYVELIPMLLKEIQELRARVKALEEREGGQ